MVYAPGTGETDPKKQNMALQQQASAISTNTTNIATNTTNIATNTTNIATNTTNIATNTSAITALQTAGTGLVNSSGSLAVSLSKLTSSLGADVAMNAGTLSTYFSGPSVAQGTSGTWFASGTLTIVDTAALGRFNVKLWDGTTIFATAQTTSSAANLQTTISVSGFLASPAGNIRIDCSSLSATGKILFNATGNSKDSTISAIRIA